MESATDNSSSDSSEEVMNHAHSAGAVQIELLLPRIAQSVAKMEVTNEEVLRVTSAYQAFRRCGQILRTNVDGDFYHESRKCQRISTFWSHSWHGRRWPKFLTLLTFYNGRAAVLLGMLGALLTTLLHALGYVPDILKDFSNSVPLVGVLVTALTMTLWYSHAEVFLDRICINGNDDEMKTEAIFSLAGFLKRSDQMLILWDPTWTQRLWCLFEFAAFLKSKESASKESASKESAKRLSIRPTIVGGVSLGTFSLFAGYGLTMTTVPVEGEIFMMPLVAAMICGILVSYPAASLMRQYFRSLDVMESELASLSVEKVSSSCCDQDHVGPSGQPVLCDRKVVRECISIWFGSEEAWVDLVRKEVLATLKEELCGNAFTTQWALGVTIPVFWANLGLAAFHAERRMWDRAASFLVDGLVLFAVSVPPMAELMIQICRLYRHEWSTPCREVCANILVICLCVLPIVSAAILYVSSSYLIYIPVSPDGQGSFVLPSSCWFLCMLIQGYCSRLLARRWKKYP